MTGIHFASWDLALDPPPQVKGQNSAFQQPPSFLFAGIVHENPRIGSDGESEEVSGASDDKDDIISPAQVKLRPQRARRTSEVGVAGSSIMTSPSMMAKSVLGRVMDKADCAKAHHPVQIIT